MLVFEAASVVGDSRRQLSSGQIPFRGVKRSSRLPSAQLLLPAHSLSGAKRARSDPPRPVSSSTHPKWMDWSDLGDGPAGLIAERLLANDVADYIRFRAVCCSWRQWSTDPRAHGILDRRFHPRKWIMLREISGHPRIFLNVSTGQCIQMPRLPELLRGHDVFGPTTEGLLVLLDRTSYIVRLLNPLTGQVTDLPPATTLLRLMKYPTTDLRKAFEVSDAGLADNSTFAIHFLGIQMLAVAKLEDKCWTLVDDNQGSSFLSAISFEGRFYCPTNRGVMVVETSENQPPRLVLAARLTKVFPLMLSTMHLVDNDGELILVYRRIQLRDGEGEQFSDTKNKCFIQNYTYRVDLKAMNTRPVLGLGGRAMFIGLRTTLSVSTSVFPSVKSDSIYVGLDDDMLGTDFGRNRLCCFTDGTTEHCGIFEPGNIDEEFSGRKPRFGPWGIDDYLSWYVTEPQDDSEDA
uniref:Uncharacterized protein n=1 Tax=Avena sativa TaxID=4498 RepID=A0ACD5XWY0_AVESA